MNHATLFPLHRSLHRVIYVLLCAALLASASPLTVGPAQARLADDPTETPVETRQSNTFLPVVAYRSGPPRPATAATIVGYVTNANGDAPLVDVTISAGSAFSTKTDGTGFFSLPVPVGDQHLTINKAGFTNDERLVTALANQVSRVQDIRLYPLDAKTVAINANGGSTTNSLNNSSLAFPAGALATTQNIRVTYLPNSGLPGGFPDGSLPMGFSNFEPAGLVFPQGKEVLWTVEYNGALPVGTDTLCYWWDGESGRWRDPVPGKVVQLANGKKALQARVAHFSAYGHALPGVAGQQPGQGGQAGVSTANAGQGSCQTDCPGSATNVGAGSVAEGYTFLPVSSRGFPVLLAARYSTSNDTPTVTARVPFTVTSQTPASANWRLEFQGKTYTGTGFNAQADWDTRNALGYRVAPGLYPFSALETFRYDSGAQPSLQISGTVEVRRGDISPFGFNWLTRYDTLLIDNTSTVTLIQGDGQYLTYTRQANGSYTPPGEEQSTLVRNAAGSWTRTPRFGGKEEFNVLGRLTRIEDRNGNAQTLTYAPTGLTLAPGQWGLITRLVSITDASGRVTTLTYGADGYVASVTDGIGRQYNLTHDASGNLTQITDPVGRVMAYQYDSSHLLTAYTDPQGNTTTLAYDAQRRLTRHTDALNQVRTTSYSASGNTFTDERGNATTYIPNQYGAITRIQTPVQTFNYTFDAVRRLTASDQPPQSFTYDSRGNLTEQNSYARTAFTYEATFNQPTSITDGSDNTTQFSYDGRGNLTTVTDAAGGVSRLEYDAAGQIIRASDPLNQATTVSYDTFGNPLVMSDPLGFQTTLAYDASGNLTQMTDAEGRVTQYGYDAMARVNAVTDALGRVTRYSYNANDNLTTLSDAHNNATTYTYDARNHLTQETDPLDKQTRYSYDATGNLTGVSDANGATVQYSYDALNRLTQEQYPGGSGVTYRHDSLYGLAGFVDAQVQVSYTYASGIPSAPDLAQTRLLGNSNLLSTVTYDYVAAGSPNNAAAAAELEPQPSAPISASLPAPTPPPPTPPSPGSVATPTEPPALAAEIAEWTVLPQAVELDADAQAPYRETPSATYTDVCGTISANTTWTLANSPYVVTCHVTVNSGATLTVQPGVVVKFNYCCLTLYVDGRLNANGSAANRITFTSFKDDSVGGDTNNDGNASSPAPADWGAVRFSNTSTGSVLNYAVVRYGGGYYVHNVYVNTTDITLTNSTFAYAYGNGLVLDNTLPSSLTGNTFLNNTDSAVWAPLTNNSHSITLSGNSASGNKYNGFVTSGTIGGNVTWDGDDNFPFLPYYDLTINAGAKLTLAPRTTIKFAYCCLTFYVNGTLVADTDAANPVTFTSFKDDSVGGDTNGDGSATQPAPADWGALRFSNTSTGSVLNHAIVRYGGGYWVHNVYVNTTNISLTNSTFAYAYGNGLVLDNTLPSSLTGNTFLNNTDSAVWAPLTNNSHSITLSGNSASGNKYNGFVTSGTIGGNVTWDGDDNFPFIPYYDLTINAGAKLTLAPRTTIKFAYCCLTFYVNGTLMADSDAANPITITSLNDDSVGGDTNGDGSASSPAPANWGSIRFSNTSTGSILNHAAVRHGGGYWVQNVYVNTSAIKLTNSTFAQAYGSGLVLDGASPALTGNTFTGNNTGVYITNGAAPTLHDNRISGNSEYGVQNAGGATPINAENNWWGSSNGPNDPSDDRAAGGLYNPAGKGNRVSDGVDYDPWLQITGLLYGLTIATGNNPVQTIRYSYDALNRLSSLTASGPASFIAQYSYDAAGRLTASAPATGQPGVNMSLEYDANARLTRLLNRSPDGGTPFNDFQYTYDKLGNVLSVNDGSTTSSGGATTYTYDALYQLVGVSSPGLNESYTYDEVGNRTGKNGVTYSYDAANQLVSSSDGASYSYDNNGNLRTKTVGGQTTTYTWDVNNRLTRIDFADSTFATYTYDALGRRINQRDRAGAQTWYIYNGLDLVQELDASGATLASYVYDGLDHPLSMTRGGASYYYLYDRLGNVVGLSNSAGTLVVSYRYDPWGNVIATGGSNPTLTNPFRFNGREWDAASGLYFYRLRYYDPALGRFLSRDPLALSAVGPNGYAYASNNPLNRTDPLGLLSVGWRRFWQGVAGVGIGIGTAVFIVGTAGAGASVVVLAVASGAGGAVLGGGAAVGIEVVTTANCDPTYDPWAAAGAGARGGFAGGASGAIVLVGVGAQGSLIGTSAGDLFAAGVSNTAQTARALGSAIKDMLATRPLPPLLGPEKMAQLAQLQKLQAAAVEAQNWDKAIEIGRQILSLLPPL